MGEGKGVTNLVGRHSRGRKSRRGPRPTKLHPDIKREKEKQTGRREKELFPLLPSRGIMQIPNGIDGGRRPSLQFPSPQFLFPRIFLSSPPIFQREEKGKERHQKCILRKQPFFHYGSIFRSCETSSLCHVLPGILETRAGAASSLPQNKSHLPTSLPLPSWLGPRNLNMDEGGRKRGSMARGAKK